MGGFWGRTYVRAQSRARCARLVSPSKSAWCAVSLPVSGSKLSGPYGVEINLLSKEKLLFR